MTKPSLVLFLGSVRPGEFETMLAHGHRLGIILDENRQAKLPSQEGFDWVARHDFSRPCKALDPLLAAVQERFEVIAVVNLREFYVRAHAYVASALNRPGLPPEAVERVLNKTLMRQAFIEALGPECTPRFQELAGLDEALRFTRRAGFPVILKPNNLYGSLFVGTVYNEAELRREFVRIEEQVRAHSASFGVVQSLEKIIQIEEFVTGTVHSIDCLIDNRQNVHLTPVVDVLTGHDVGQNHFGHVVRKADSCLPPVLQARMGEMAVGAVTALGIRNATAHVELIASPAGPKLLEVAARAGGHRNRVLEMTHGLSINYQHLRMLLGETLDVAPKYTRPFAIVTPYPKKELTFQGVRRLDAVTRLASYHRHEVKAGHSARIGPARHGFMSSWQVELCHPDREVLHGDLAWLSAQRDFFEETTCVS